MNGMTVSIKLLIKDNPEWNTDKEINKEQFTRFKYASHILVGLHGHTKCTDSVGCVP